jgi:CO/xanthine dehydrogenase Mo-binding subunit
LRTPISHATGKRVRDLPTTLDKCNGELVSAIAASTRSEL